MIKPVPLHPPTLFFNLLPQGNTVLHCIKTKQKNNNKKQDKKVLVSTSNSVQAALEFEFTEFKSTSWFKMV